MAVKATVYNIQSYSIHDGPGIRTVVFLKGCSLRCKWCSNPESQDFENELYYSELKCIKCGTCLNACSHRALYVNDSKKITVNKSLCTKCGECVQKCPTGALKVSGEEMTSDEIVERIERERQYIINSGGGVTFSGGEPLANPNFVSETAKALKEKGYHVAVETSGFVPYKNVRMCIPYVDLFLFDMKAGTSDTHKKFTGCGNKLILENMARIHSQKPLIVRIPVIPGINDTDAEIDGMTISIISLLGENAEVNLLPYHQLGKPKYTATGRTYELSEIEVPTDEYMDNLLKKFVTKGINAKII